MHEKGIVDRFSGVYSAIFTPYNPDGTLNRQVLKRLIDYHVKVGLHGIYVGGSTGEGLLMNLDERKSLTEASVEYLDGRGNAIIHIGAVATRDAVELARHAEECGADAVSAIPPIFFGTSIEGITRHYTAIAEASALPFFVYNIPERAGVTLTFENILALAEIDNICGIKFTSSDLFTIHLLTQHFGNDFLVINGSDQILAAGLLMGAHGGIGTTYNFFPEFYLKIYELAQAGNFAEARKWQYAVDRYTAKAIETGGFGSFKKTMEWLGFDCGLPRGPIVDTSAIDFTELKRLFLEIRKMVD